MKHFPIVVLLLIHFLLLPLAAFAGGTGILEVQSEPAGARIFIDDVEAGTTPYQNFDAPAGKHRVKAILSNEYPPQVQDVLIDERAPQVVLFKFLERRRGAFLGQQIERSTMKYSGSVTFASIPSGARVSINGEPLQRTTPIGYADVEVGRYSAEFVLQGRSLRADFEVIQNQTVTLIADFPAGKVITKGDQAKVPQAPAQQETPSQQPLMQDNAAAAVPVSVPVSVRSGVPQADVGPQPQGDSPFGELVIKMHVRRDANLKASDFFDVISPNLPNDSLSGPLFPAATARTSAFKDSFEYKNNPSFGTRQFSARIHFGLWDTGPAETRAASSIMTVKEGTYELKLARSRIVDHFYSVEKIANEISQETIQILRGNRLTVEIEGLYDASNKMGYQIKRSYQDLTKKKKNGKKEKTEKSEKSSDKEPKENRSPLFMPITE